MKTLLDKLDWSCWWEVEYTGVRTLPFVSGNHYCLLLWPTAFLNKFSTPLLPILAKQLPDTL